MNIDQDGSSRNNPHFIYIRKILFHLGIIRSLFYSNFVLFGTIDLIVHINSYFDTKYHEL